MPHRLCRLRRRLLETHMGCAMTEGPCRFPNEYYFQKLHDYACYLCISKIIYEGHLLRNVPFGRVHGLVCLTVRTVCKNLHDPPSLGSYAQRIPNRSLGEL